MVPRLAASLRASLPVLLVAAGVCLPRPAESQRVTGTGLPRTADACVAAFEDPDTTTVQLYWLLQPVGVSKEEITHENMLQHARILQELRLLYRHPPAPEVVVTPELIFRQWEQEGIAVGQEATEGRGQPVISALVEFTLHHDGRIEDVEMLGGWAAPALLLAMAAAVDSARTRGVLETLSERTLPDGPPRRRSVRLRLVLHDTPDRDLAHLPVGTIRTPAFTMRSLSIRQTVEPRYPRGLIAEDDLLIYVVVSANGRAEPETFRLLRGSFQALADAARRALLRWEFSPARIGECAVRQEVLIPIAFRRERN